MQGSASWLPPALRTLLLGTLLAAAWIIFGAVSAQASGPLPPLTDTVSVIAGSGTAPVPAPKMRAITEPVLAPVDAAVAPAAAPVTAVVGQVASAAAPVTAIASAIVAPVTTTVAEVTAPITGVVADVAAPVPAPVGSVVGDVATLVTDAEPAAADPAAVSPADNADPVSPSRTAVNEGTTSEFLQDVRTVAPQAQADVADRRLMAAPTQAPERPGPAPAAPVSPATAPAGSGSTLRAGNDAGSGLAADVPAFQFSLTQISLRDILNTSDELPGSVSLEHGFSPD